LSRLEPPTGTKGPHFILVGGSNRDKRPVHLSRLEPPTGIKIGAFIPVVVLHRDRNLLLVFFFLPRAALSISLSSLISISPPILPSLSYLLPSPTLPPLVAQPERLTERRAAGGEAPGGRFGHVGGSARVASERRSRRDAVAERDSARVASERRLRPAASDARGERLLELD